MRAVVIVAILLWFSGISAQTQWTIYNTSNSSIPDNVIRCLTEDAQGNVWIGTDNGIARYNGNNFVVFDSSNANLPVNQIRSLAFDSLGNLWVGTFQAGLVIYDGQSWTAYNSQNSALPDDQVRAVNFDKSGSVWLGTTGGVVQINDEGWSIYDIFNSPLMANNINCIFTDAQNSTWVGTVNGGLSRHTGSVWTTYTHQNSNLLDNTVYDVTDDVFGNLWFATPAQGLGRFDGTSWYFRSIANSLIPTNSLTAVQVVKSTDVKYIGSADKGLIRWTNGFAFDSFTVNNSPMPENHVSCLLQYNDSTFYIGTSNSGLVKFIDTTNYPLVSGVSVLQNDIRLIVYPNPASSEVYLVSPMAKCKYEIVTTLGVVVKVGEVEEDSPIDIRALSNGIYLLHLHDIRIDASTRFVKE